MCSYLSIYNKSYLSKLISKLLLLTILVLNLANHPNNFIKEIKIIGNYRVEQETIINYLAVEVEQQYNQHKIDQSLKKLFDTGLFSDIKIDLQNNNLIIKVIENPIINKIIVEGSDKIKQENILNLMSLKSRSTFNKSKLQSDITKIIELYNRSGRYSVNINPKIVELPQNRIDLIYEINEGAKTTIKKIYISGNKQFNDNKIKSIINTKEAKWYNFLSTNDTYDPDRIEYDKELLRRFYNSEGYANFKISSTITQLSPKRDSFILTISLEEGEKYRFGKIEVINNLANDLSKSLDKIVIVKENKWYNYDEVEDSIDELIKYMNDHGYAFVNIEPEINQNQEAKLINIKFIIQKGRKAYLNNINITGNLKTKDEVIRREFRIAEADPFNATLINRSEQRIRNLDYFDKIEFQKKINDTQDQIDLNINVNEKSTASFNIGGGITSEEKSLSPIAQISFSENNLFGTGNKLGLSLQKAKKRTDIDLSFTNPYFLGKELSTGFDIFRLKSDRRKSSPYQDLAIGSILRVGYDLNEYLNHTVRYTIKKDVIKNSGEKNKNDQELSIYIKEQLGTTITSSIGHSLLYDKTDSKIITSRGYWIRLDQELAGLGRKSAKLSQFIRNEVNARYYRPVYNDKIIFNLAGNIGYINGLGKIVKINERFFVGDIGQYGLRGFETGGIGPRIKNQDQTVGDPLGGNFYYTSTASLSFPMGLPAELDISGRLFIDAGSLHKIDFKKSEKALKKADILMDKSLRVSTGFGVVWLSKIGPIRIDIAHAIKKKKYDKRQLIHFSYATDL